jgi:hypothetical protein
MVKLLDEDCDGEVEIDLDTGKIAKPRTVKVRDPKTEGYDAVVWGGKERKQMLDQIDKLNDELLAKNETIQRLEAEIETLRLNRPIIENHFHPNPIGLALLDELIAHISGYKMTGKVGLIAKLQRIKEKL